jgi:putative redox protein
VFDPRRRPWIVMANSDTATITAQVERCPSGALSWKKDEA